VRIQSDLSGRHTDMRPEYTPEESNTRLPSTTWKWERVIIKPPAKGMGQRAASAPSKPLSSRDPRKPITIELEYRGGASARWRIRARGRTWHFSGVMALQDVMARINATLAREED
jgi:hypothetical protein